MVSYGEYITLVIKKGTINAAFPVLETDKKYGTKLDTAKGWAVHGVDGKLVRGEIVKNVPNLFKKGTARIYDFDKRGNGGRAWKIAVTYNNEEYALDLREPELLEIMQDYGIGAGGVILTDLMIAFYPNYRVQVHKKDTIEKLQEENIPRKKLEASELEAGNVYRNLKGDHFYLGKVRRCSIYDLLNGQHKWKMADASITYYDESIREFMSREACRICDTALKMTFYSKKVTEKPDISFDEFYTWALDKNNEAVVNDLRYSVTIKVLKSSYFLAPVTGISSDKITKIKKDILNTLRIPCSHWLSVEERKLRDELRDKLISELA